MGRDGSLPVVSDSEIPLDRRLGGQWLKRRGPQAMRRRRNSKTSCHRIASSETLISPCPLVNAGSPSSDLDSEAFSLPQPPPIEVDPLPQCMRPPLPPLREALIPLAPGDKRSSHHLGHATSDEGISRPQHRSASRSRHNLRVPAGPPATTDEIVSEGSGFLPGSRNSAANPDRRGWRRGCGRCEPAQFRYSRQIGRTRAGI